MSELSNNGAGDHEATGRPVQGAGGDRKRTSREPAVPAPDPQLVERPRRRKFTAEYKVRVVREADGCSKPGEVGALLRREGLYSSHLSVWRKQRTPGHWWRWLSHAAGRRDPRDAQRQPASPSRAGRGGARESTASKGAGKRLRASGRAARAQGRQRATMIEQRTTHSHHRDSPGVPDAGRLARTIYRRRRPPAPRPSRPRPKPARALSEPERPRRVERAVRRLRSCRMGDAAGRRPLPGIGAHSDPRRPGRGRRAAQPARAEQARAARQAGDIQTRGPEDLLLPVRHPRRAGWAQSEAVPWPSIVLRTELTIQLSSR